MSFDLRIFETTELEPDFVEWLVDERYIEFYKHFNKFWEYYKNTAIDISGSGVGNKAANRFGKSYVLAQEYGLPSRITGLSHSANVNLFGGQAIKDVQRKEVVIENDIAWRVNSLVDFLFGKSVNIVSKSPSANKRAEIRAF